MDHTSLDQQSGLRHDGDDRHRGARALRVQPAARRADARRQPAVRAGADDAIRARRPRSSRPTSRSRSNTRSTRSPARASSGRTRAEGQSQVFAEFRMSTDMTKAMQDVRDKIGQVRPGFPQDVKEPLVIRADQENQQPVVSLAVLSPTMTLRDLTSLTDQTIVKALENVPGVARIDVSGRVTRQILGPDQAQRGDVARHRRRPGDQRDPRREPGRPGGPHHARQDRFDRPRRGQDQGSGAVRADHRRAAGRRAGLPVAGRGRHRRREGERRRSRGSTAGRRSRSTSRNRRTRTSSTRAAASPPRSTR